MHPPFGSLKKIIKSGYMRFSLLGGTNTNDTCKVATCRTQRRSVILQIPVGGKQP